MSVDSLMQWLTESGVALAERVVAAAAILAVGAIAVCLLSRFLRRIVDRRASDRELLERFFVSIAVKAAWVVLAITVLAKLGVDIGPLLAGLGATGIVLGFACQESLGSLAAGIMIAFNRPFRIGDFVSVAGYEGVIRHLDMMAVTLTTVDNRRVTIPNKQAWGTAIVNFSAMPLRRVEIIVGVAYSSDLSKACAVAIETLTAMPAVMRDPEPTSLVKSLADSSVTLAFRAWVRNEDYWSVLSDATRLIKEAYDRAGIRIPFPQVDVHMAPTA